jgi:hypothetical protein
LIAKFDKLVKCVKRYPILKEIEIKYELLYKKKEIKYEPNFQILVWLELPMCQISDLSLLEYFIWKQMCLGIILSACRTIQIVLWVSFA